MRLKKQHPARLPRSAPELKSRRGCHFFTCTERNICILIHFFISSKSRLPQDIPSFAKPGDAKKQAAGRLISRIQNIAGKNDIPGGLNPWNQKK
jgi:hypothetical protein